MPIIVNMRNRERTGNTTYLFLLAMMRWMSRRGSCILLFGPGLLRFETTNKIDGLQTSNCFWSGGLQNMVSDFGDEEIEGIVLDHTTVSFIFDDDAFGALTFR